MEQICNCTAIMPLYSPGGSNLQQNAGQGFLRFMCEVQYIDTYSLKPVYSDLVPKPGNCSRNGIQRKIPWVAQLGVLSLSFLSLMQACQWSYIHCVPKKRDHVFGDKLNQNCPFTKIFGLLITKTIGRRQMFLFSHLTYLMQLLYLRKLSRPRYQQKLQKIMKISQKKDVILINNLYLSKQYGARRALSELPDKVGNLKSLTVC